MHAYEVGEKGANLCILANPKKSLMLYAVLFHFVADLNSNFQKLF